MLVLIRPTWYDVAGCVPARANGTTNQEGEQGAAHR